MKRGLCFILATLIILFCHSASYGFSSGSTGSLGALNPTASIEITLPGNGILNYTTVTIPAGVTVTFKTNAANTPVYMLATGNVTIAGTINVSGGHGSGVIPGKGGPGGFDGGLGGSPMMGGTPATPGGKGQGLGGGNPGSPSNNVSAFTGGGSGGGGSFATMGTTGASGNAVNAPGGTGGETYGNYKILPIQAAPAEEEEQAYHRVL